MTRFTVVGCRSSDLIHHRLPLKQFGLSFMVSFVVCLYFPRQWRTDAILIVCFLRCLFLIFSDNDTMLPQQSFEQVHASFKKKEKYFGFSNFALLLKALYYPQNIRSSNNPCNADLGVQRQNQFDQGSFSVICN